MAKTEKGLIFTNENCVGCNRCIAQCPVFDANISVRKNGQNHIVVDGKKCIRCGKCLQVCTHEAREYEDDTVAFLNALRNGEKVSLLIAPSFYLDFRNDADRILAALKLRGVSSIYNVSFGADITTWGMIRYLEEIGTRGMITATCPVVVNYIEKQSDHMIKYLAPIHSPMMCTAIYARKYLNDDAKFAFLGPCIAKKDEIMAPQTHGNVQFNVTYRHLMEALGQLPMEYDTPEIQLKDYGLGVIYPFPGGIKKNLESILGVEKSIFSMTGAVRRYHEFSMYEDVLEKGNMKSTFIVDALNCDYGCLRGTGVDSGSCGICDVWVACAEKSQEVSQPRPDYAFCREIRPSERKRRLFAFFDHLDINDFRREYSEKFEQPVNIPEDTIQEIFHQMHKTTPDKQRIDCHSCGYDSCRTMASAIALGHNRMENCVHYEKDENLRLYLTDTMTGIPNVNAFTKKIASIIESDMMKSYTAFSISAMDWELVNERYGYDAGDMAIVEFAHKLQSYVMSDEMVARLGSVNFLAVVKNENSDTFIKRLSGIKIVADDIDRSEFSVSVCAGVYCLDGSEKAVGDVISRINIAATVARSEEASNIVFYDEKMRAEIIDNMLLTKSFPEAIERGEFVVFFQPKVSIESMKMRGAEALVRWNTSYGLISPGRFIPIFEKNGCVKQLDFHVLELVCKQLRNWIDRGIEPVRISSNFSKQHFRNTDVVDRIMGIVDSYQIPHDLIEIEFTETAYMDEHERLKETLTALKKKGFSSSIDDFGSGYSSLNMLSNLDFEVLKLDRSFLMLGASDRRTQKIIGNVIHMAKELNMVVVAEGVEREEELEMLKELSCDMIQGFFFDRPLTSEDFERRLLNKDYTHANNHSHHKDS